MEKEYKIVHPDIENPGYCFEESLPNWLELGWSVAEDEPEEEPTVKYVTKIVKGKETLVEETPLPDKKESVQDNTVVPKEI
jgi:hypothetical protein